MGQLLWSTLADPNFREKVKQRPQLFLGNRGQAGLQGLILNGLKGIIRGAENLEKARLTLQFQEEVLTVTLQLDKEDDLDNWLNKQNLTIFSDLAILKNLSETFTITLTNKNQFQKYQYQDGLLIHEKKAAVQNKINLVMISFKPNYQSFNEVPLPYTVYYDFCRRIAMLNAGLVVQLSDDKQQNYFHYQTGLVEYLYENDEYFSRKQLPFYSEQVFGQAKIKVAISRNDQAQVAASFVNNEQTHKGGSHFEGMLDGIVLAMNKFLTANNILVAYDQEMLINRFDLVIAVQLPNPKYYGVTRQKLRNPEMYNFVKECVSQELLSFLYRYPIWYRG